MNRLIGQIARLVLAGFILSVNGCAYDDTFRHLREQQPESESLAIAFSNGIIDNPVQIKKTNTRAVSLLSDHTESMGVWGWQTTSEGVTGRIFQNQKVTFSTTLDKWTYSPVKYWENKSSYRFYAYAPYAATVEGATASIDSATHAISITGVTLSGSNTIDSGVPVPPSRFSRVTDTDWMIDRSGQSMQGIYRNEVMFNLQHILSKLCVRVRRSDNFMPDSVLAISIDSLKLSSFVSQGDFVQAPDNSHLTLAAEWTPIDTMPRYTLTSAKHVSIPDSAVYILESLLIPQRVNTDQFIRIWYSIGNPGGYINHMDNIFSLNELFIGFETGKNYVITVTIGPDPIKFDAGVQDWTNNYSDDHSIFARP